MISFSSLISFLILKACNTNSFEKNATTEFADWAEDAPKNYFEIVYEKWKEKHSIKEDIEEVDQLIKKELNDW